MENDHPLYVLRKIEGGTLLVKAFEKGENSTWRKCTDVQKHGGYNLGEPLYHVLAGDRFIDVKSELANFGGDDAERIPLFATGGK